MQMIKYFTLPAALLVASGEAAAIMHAGAPVQMPVPADAPWALGALGVLVSVVVARAIRNRKD